MSDGEASRVSSLRASLLAYELACREGADLREAARVLEEAAAPTLDCYVGRSRAVMQMARSYAHAFLGYIYGTGKEGSENCQRAFDFYRIAADIGVGEAQANLGGMYYYGVQNVVDKDRRTASLWFERASADVVSPSGDASLDGQLNWLGRKPRIHLQCKPPYQIYSMKQLARIHLQGLPHERLTTSISSPLTGLRCLLDAAMGGCAEAQLWFGSFFLVGFSDFCDRRKALFWLNKSANHGNSAAVKVSRKSYSPVFRVIKMSICFEYLFVLLCSYRW